MNGLLAIISNNDRDFLTQLFLDLKLLTLLQNVTRLAPPAKPRRTLLCVWHVNPDSTIQMIQMTPWAPMLVNVSAAICPTLPPLINISTHPPQWRIEGAWRATPPPPTSQIFLDFMQFSETLIKFYPGAPLSEGWRPSPICENPGSATAPITLRF